LRAEVQELAQPNAAPKLLLLLPRCACCTMPGTGVAVEADDDYAAACARAAL